MTPGQNRTQPALDLMTHLIKNGPYHTEKSHRPTPTPSHSEHIWLSSSQSIHLQYSVGRQVRGTGAHVAITVCVKQINAGMLDESCCYNGHGHE